MKILWITNTIFPAPSKELGLSIPVVGGWMYASAKSLIKTEHSTQLAVATVYNGKELKLFHIDGIKYYLIPYKGDKTKYSKKLEPFWRLINDEFEPDVVHIHGTEFAHALSFINTCQNKNVVISIQGLVSVCTRYYYAGMSIREIINNITLRDIIRRDNIFHQKRKMAKRGEIEKEYILAVNHIIGRTSWDKSQTKAINSETKYHFCNETLREEFYKNRWSFDNCEPYTIFLSQAGYPIKSLHQVIKALSYVIKKNPNVKVYIAGSNITKSYSLIDKIKLSGYGNYIRKLIKRNKLEDVFFFTGFLSAEEMTEQYLKSHLFICPSSIENSPNSLGEAQILGVPCIASYVGGVPDMVEDKITGFMYRFEEIEMLASLICHVFEMSKEDIEELSSNERKVALKRHDQINNTRNLIDIYNEINN